MQQIVMTTNPINSLGFSLDICYRITVCIHACPAGPNIKFNKTHIKCNFPNSNSFRPLPPKRLYGTFKGKILLYVRNSFGPEKTCIIGNLDGFLRFLFTQKRLSHINSLRPRFVCLWGVYVHSHHFDSFFT